MRTKNNEVNEDNGIIDNGDNVQWGQWTIGTIDNRDNGQLGQWTMRTIDNEDNGQ